jgi:cyclopropane fatty-acyl-phospholipid synthase-like methyltransferase
MCELVRRNSPNTVLINDDVMKVNFQPETFDLICAMAMIHVFPTDIAKDFLDKLHVWLKKKGILILDTTVNKRFEEGFFEKKDYQGGIIRYRTRYTPESFEELITSPKFRVIDKCYKQEEERGKRWMRFACTKIA